MNKRTLMIDVVWSVLTAGLYLVFAFLGGLPAWACVELAVLSLLSACFSGVVLWLA